MAAQMARPSLGCQLCESTTTVHTQSRRPDLRRCLALSSKALNCNNPMRSSQDTRHVSAAHRREQASQTYKIPRAGRSASDLGTQLSGSLPPEMYMSATTTWRGICCVIAKHREPPHKYTLCQQRTLHIVHMPEFTWASTSPCSAACTRKCRGLSVGNMYIASCSHKLLECQEKRQHCHQKWQHAQHPSTHRGISRMTDIMFGMQGCHCAYERQHHQHTCKNSCAALSICSIRLAWWPQNPFQHRTLHGKVLASCSLCAYHSNVHKISTEPLIGR